jgi:hypothetical protein
VGGAFETLKRRSARPQVLEERKTAPAARYIPAGTGTLYGEKTSLAPLMEPPGFVPPDIT